MIRPAASWLLLLLFSVACDDGRSKGNPEGAPPRHKTVDPDDPSACGECHAQIVAEWRESMHARAHHESDLIYGGVHRLVQGKLGSEATNACARCHEPRGGTLGVTCATCHMLDEVHVGQGKAGVDALVFADAVRMRAGHDMAPGSSPAHETGKAPSFITDRQTLCLACHDMAANPSGVTTCATGAEFKERSTDEGCIDCHMPRVDGPGGEVGSRSEHARHVFLGPHQAWYQDDASFLAGAVSLKGVITDQGLDVTLTNRSGHAFPTGFPGRMAVLMAIGKDAEETVLWRNIQSDPMAESPGSVFNKVYVDDVGQPTMPVFSKSMKRDNRLKPAEKRTLSFELPVEVVSVELKLVLRLVPPPAHEKLGIAGKVEAESRVVATASVTR